MLLRAFTARIGGGRLGHRITFVFVTNQYDRQNHAANEQHGPDRDWNGDHCGVHRLFFRLESLPGPEMTVRVLRPLLVRRGYFRYRGSLDSRRARLFLANAEDSLAAGAGDPLAGPD
jgi:hypothetical protein